MTGTRAMERLTLHFDLRHCPDANDFTLKVCGKHYPLQPHSPDTFTHHASLNKALRLIPEEAQSHMTHYAVDVEVPADEVGIHTVVYPAANADDALPRLALMFTHVPSKARRRHLRRMSRSANGLRVPAVLARYGITELPADEEEETAYHSSQLVTPLEAAKTLVASHPDIGSLNPDVAAITLQHYIDSVLHANHELAYYISSHQVKDEDGSNSGDGWYTNAVQTFPDGTVIEPSDLLKDKDGKPIVWPTQNGKRVIPEWRLSEGTARAATSAIQQVVKLVKQAPELAGQLWTVQHGVPNLRETSSATGPKRLHAATVTDLQSLDGYKWTIDIPGSQFMVQIDKDSLSFDGTNLSIKLKNTAVRSLGVSVQFIDEDDKPIVNKHTSKSGIQHLQYLGSGNVVFGIPFPTNFTTFNFELPDDAVKATLLLGGLGRGKYEEDLDEEGLILTLVLNYGVPLALMALSVGLSSTGWLQSLSASEIKAIIIGSAVPVAAVITALMVDGYLDVKQLLAKATEFLSGLILKSIPFLAEKIAAFVSAQWFIDSVPIIGTVARVASIASSFADMAATTVEVAISPSTYEIDIARAISLSVRVSPDPIHGFGKQHPIWPKTSHKWEVIVQIKNGASYTQKGEMPQDPTAPIQVNWDAIPAAPGGSLQVTANIYSSTEWLCGRWQSEWVPVVANDGGTTLNMSGSIIEALVPLTASTRYSHLQQLDYKNGKHVWVDGNGSQPTEVVTDLDCSPAGGKLCLPVNVTINNDAYALGYSYRAVENLPIDNDNKSQQELMYVFQSISVLSDPEAEMIVPTRGFSIRPLIVFDQFGMAPLFSVSNSYVNTLDENATSQQLAQEFSSHSSDYTLMPDATVNVVTKGQQWTIGQPSETPLYTLAYTTDGTAAVINVSSFGGTSLLFTLPGKYQTDLNAGGTASKDLKDAFSAASTSYALPANPAVHVVTKSVEWQICSSDGTPLYDLKRSVDSIGVFKYPAPAYSKRNYYLDPRTKPKEGSYYLRQINLDPDGASLDYSAGTSFGTFTQLDLDALVIHPSGYAIAVDYKNHKMEVLKLPSDGVDDAKAPPALLLSGEGVREGLMQGPVALTVTADGRVLILEQTNARVQAFDAVGNPVQCFKASQKFSIDPKFATDLDNHDPSAELQQVYQQHVAPILAELLHVDTTYAQELNTGHISTELVADFGRYGITLSADAQVTTTTPDKLWHITDPANAGLFDVRLVHSAGEILVRRAAVLQSEVVVAGSEWLLRDVTNTLTWEVTKSGDGTTLNAQQLVSIMLLKDSQDSKVTYLDISTETKSFIYVLSYENDGKSLQDYHLDIYNPDGTFLCRTPDEGKSGVNGAKLVVDQWRNAYTLNYGVFSGPGGLTEPKISIWTPSTPQG
jgi:hypothetical protein